MSPIDNNTINKKISRLERNIKVLQKYKNTPIGEFIDDLTISGAASFYLIESIEIIVDIANHILSEKFAVSPENYADSIRLLGENGVTPKDFAEENKEMAKFRNKVIHLYDDINIKMVYGYLQEAPDVFIKFSEYFINFINKK